MQDASEPSIALDRDWARVGGIAGALTIVGYGVTRVDLLPAVFGRLVFFAVPVFGVVFLLALGRFLGAHRVTVALQVGTVFGVIGFACMNLMAVVQWSSSIWMSMNPPSSEVAPRELVRWVRQSVHSVQLGMDVSYDIFFDSSLILFGLAMLRDPRFGRVFGVLGILVAGATLVLNLSSFPVPPRPDPGPLIALWGLAVCVRMLVSTRPDPVKE